MVALLNEVWKQQYSVLFSAAGVLSTFAFLSSHIALARQAQTHFSRNTSV